MKCPECDSSNTRLEGEDDNGIEFYECLDCGNQFDETEAE
jgi:Zn ribbon nucleic-acid-binding protein